ncbi:MAG: hypothetical protein IJN63_09020 [Clostridia bacterium]|nr:hypothetical protein [Clostridia bacterium]
MSFKKIKKQLAFSLSLCVMLPLCACSGDGADVNDPLSDSAQPAHSDTVLSDASDTERVEPATEYPSLALDISGSQYKNNGQHTFVRVSAEAVNTVKKELFGDNISWRGEGYGIYDKDTDTFNSRLVEMIRKAGITTLRCVIEREKENIASYTDREDEIKIQITEYGPMGTYYNGTVGAVFLASLLQVMANEPMISSANHLPMLNHPAAANLIGYDPQGLTEYYWDNVCTYVFR